MSPSIGAHGRCALEFDSCAGLGGRTVRPPRRDIREQRRELNGRVDTLAKELNDRIESFAADVSKRFDDVKRELAELRERMAKLEGSLEGFLTGRRDRDVA